MRFGIKKLVALCLSFTLMTSISACAIEEITIEKDSVVTLNDCIKIALENSPLIKRFKYNYGVSKSNVGLAKSAYFPTLGVSTGYTFNDSSSSGRYRSMTNRNSYNVEASLNQLIWKSGISGKQTRI